MPTVAGGRQPPSTAKGKPIEERDWPRNWSELPTPGPMGAEGLQGAGVSPRTRITVFERMS